MPSVIRSAAIARFIVNWQSRILLSAKRVETGGLTANKLGRNTTDGEETGTDEDQRHRPQAGVQSAGADRDTRPRCDTIQPEDGSDGQSPESEARWIKARRLLNVHQSGGSQCEESDMGINLGRGGWSSRGRRRSGLSAWRKGK